MSTPQRTRLATWPALLLVAGAATSAQAIESRKPHLMNGNRIDHVVVLMLENRSFDHFMGWLYDGSVKPKFLYPKDAGIQVPPNQSKLRSFEGLAGLDEAKLQNPYTLDGKQDFLVPIRGARAPNIPQVNPHEDFIHVMEDLYNKGHDKMADKTEREQLIGGLEPTMNGWAANFIDAIRHTAEKEKPKNGELNVTKSLLSQIMETYVPNQLPVLSGLARNYAVSDLWFCSVPSQTTTNRAFVISGTARGLVTNDYYDPEGRSQDALPDTSTMFDVLSKHGVPWMFVAYDKWPPVIGKDWYEVTMFPSLKAKKADSKLNANFQNLAYFKQLAKTGDLKAVTFIEPHFGGGYWWGSSKRLVGNEFHPVADTTVGEFFVKEVYDALFRDGKNWKNTLLVITFDENGGTYDHFPPWRTTAMTDTRDKDANVPTDDDRKRIGGARTNIGGEVKKGMRNSTTETQFGFQFDRYGVRVPTLLISPYVKQGTLFRSPTDVPFDHTSIIASILTWQGIDPKDAGLGERVAKAPIFNSVLQEKVARKQDDVTSLGQRTSKAPPIKHGDVFTLSYIGNTWSKTAKPHWISGVESSLGSWYPTVGEEKDAIPFTVVGDKNASVTTGSKVQLTIADADVKYKGQRLIVPAYGSRGTAIFLRNNQDDMHSQWRIYPVASRNDGESLYPGDEVIIFTQAYMPESIGERTGVSSAKSDPYYRLTVDSESNPKFLGFRAGEWAVWKVTPWKKK